ncbi:hypothetical protein [Nocardia nova]|uniref:hypothetical protein n=1 Tax=Nocardia nova TaxID=37330 RepID=UPI0033DEC8B1
MTSITEHYNITGTVPFADVQIEFDNRLFLDPHAIRLQTTPAPFAAQANRCTDTFFEEIAACVVSPNAADHERGLALLQRFSEPRETRLGMAAEGINGHGGAEDVGAWIWEACTTDLRLFFHLGILREIEAIPLFVKGIDNDITSDLTTRIIFEPLAMFTREMIRRYPQFTANGHRTTTVIRQVWNPVDRKWEDKAIELPVANSQPLVLVPHNWLRPRLLMNSRRFYEKTGLDFAQFEQAVRTETGKTLLTPKDLLKQQPGLGRGRRTNRELTRRAIERDRDLIREFRAWVDSRWTPPAVDDAA